MNEIDILSEALGIAAPEERRRFLDEASGDDRDLRNRAEALLRSSDRVAGDAESPPTGWGGAPTVSAPTESQPSTLVGPYKLLQQIGEGGMGVVYMAEQQALALMDHISAEVPPSS